MFKFVVSDLDGTLIFGQNELTPKIINMLEALNDRNIYFAVASGRKICELLRIFEKFKDNIIFIACDGAYVTYKRKVLFEEIISEENIESGFKQFHIPITELKDKAGNTVKIIVKSEDLTDRAREYIKINRLFSMVYDDCGAVEYVKYGINKGTALKKVLNILGIKQSEVVAFGDNYNDLELLKLTPNSYFVSGGKEEIKKICRYETKDVCDSIEEILKRER